MCLRTRLRDASVWLLRAGEPDIHTQLFDVPSPTIKRSARFFNVRRALIRAYDAVSLYSNLAFAAQHRRQLAHGVERRFAQHWETNAANRRRVRFYPLKNADGSTVANAYVLRSRNSTAATIRTTCWHYPQFPVSCT